MRWRAGLFCALVLQAFLWLGAGTAAAATPPTIQVDVVGSGSVSGSGISCGLGSVTCYSAYGSTAAVTLTAAASSGWTITDWLSGSGATICGATTTCAVTPGTASTVVLELGTTGPVQTSTFGVSLPTGSSTARQGTISSGSTTYPISCDEGGATPATQCSLTVDQSSTLTVTQAAAAGFTFANWGGSCGGAGPSCSVYLSGNSLVSGNFPSTSANVLTVSVSGSGSVSGGGVSCGAGSTCDAAEPQNSSVTLTATPVNGWVLTGWSGGCTGIQSTCTVQMDQARTVMATFQQQVQLSVTVIGGAGNFVSGGGIGCDVNQTCTAGEAPNTTVTLTANAVGGASVLWSGCTSTAGNTCSVTMGTTPSAVTASFSGGSAPPISTNQLNVTVKGDGYVTVLVGSATIYCTSAGGSGCTATVPAGSSLTLSAVPASGVSGDFQHWLGDCSSFTTTTCTLTMSSAKNVEADFVGTSTTYLLNGQVNGSGTISGAGLSCSSGASTGCSVAQAASATLILTATPSFGATFTGWGGACSGTGTCTVSMTTAKTVIATFTTAARLSTTAQLSIGVAGAGTVKATAGSCTNGVEKLKTCIQKYDLGKSVTLTATAAPGAKFTGWTGACFVKTTTCTVTMTSDLTVGATFTTAPFAETRKPAVVQTKTGFRVTLYYATTSAGTLKLVATKAGKTVVAKSSKARKGTGKISFTVSKGGRYVFTLTLGKHSLRWGIPVG